MAGMKRLASVLSLCFLLIALAACSTNPATGRSSFTAFMSPDEEVRVGGQEHPKLVQQFGGEYPDRELDAYVRKVGLSLSQTTEMPNLPYSFTVLDDEMINAFALPGGYVHVTRGLLALASNEAEMAGVLAHELGHVTARHSAERYSQGVLAGIGATIVGVAGAAAGVPGVGDAAGYGAQAYLQSYSRDQELEADRLGIRYMTNAGYDPAAMASFFRKLDAFAQLEATIAGDPGAADRFGVMASHPRTSDRVAQAIRLAKEAHVAEPKLGSDTYLSHIDGLVYGDSPAQGVRRDRDFYHPGLRITFRVPPGFVMFNSPQQVVARGPQKAVIAFDMESEGTARSVRDMRSYVGETWGGRLNLQRVEAIDVNGMPAATAATRINTNDGAMDLRLVAIRERPERIFRMIFLTPPSLTRQLSAELQRTTYSFKRLTAAEAMAIKPLRVDVVTVRTGDTAESLAARMPFVSYRLERFLALNGLGRGQEPLPGDKVKVIVE
jgi:predicted Zn-dependent protease